MELPYAAEGIILASDKYREKDRMLTIYTNEFGKIRAISRGSRKASSKLSPHLEPLAWVNLMLVNGKGITTLTGCFQIKNFSNLKNKGAYILLALYLAELIDSVTPENLPDDKIFGLLLALLDYLNQSKPALAMPEIIILFKLKLLEILGLRPEKIGEMPENILELAQSDSFDLGPSDLEGWNKSKLGKILEDSFADILDRQITDFKSYVSLFNAKKVI